MIDPSANKNSLRFPRVDNGCLWSCAISNIANINYHTYRYDRLSRLFGSIERCTKSQEGDRRKERFTPSSCQNEEILSTRHYFPKADALLSISSFVESFRRSYVRACTLFRSPLEADVIFHFTKWITRLGAEAFPVDTHGCIPDIEINEHIELACSQGENYFKSSQSSFLPVETIRKFEKKWYPIRDWFVILIIERRYLEISWSIKKKKTKLRFYYRPTLVRNELPFRPIVGNR